MNTKVGKKDLCQLSKLCQKMEMDKKKSCKSNKNVAQIEKAEAPLQLLLPRITMVTLLKKPLVSYSWTI